MVSNLMKKNKFVGSGNKLIVSEFVSYGHPDKIADQIADAILDEFLRKDKNTRAGIEVMVKDNIVVLGGEINSLVTIDYDKVVRMVYSELKFPDNHHLSPSDIKIINLIGKQSQEIHSGVDKTEETVTGWAKVKLIKGAIRGAGSGSKYSLYNESIASFTTGELYNHKDAEGFITLFGLPLKVRAMMEQKVGEGQAIAESKSFKKRPTE